MKIKRTNRKTGNTKEMSVEEATKELTKSDEVKYQRIRLWFPKPITREVTAEHIYEVITD